MKILWISSLLSISIVFLSHVPGVCVFSKKKSKSDGSNTGNLGQSIKQKKIYDLPEEAATVGGELNQLKQKKHNPVLFYTVCTSEC